MRSRAAGRGKISPRCVHERASDKKNASSWQYIAAMYSDSANFGKICVPCIRKAPQSAVGEYTARASCRQGAFSPSEALKPCTARRSRHAPPATRPRRRAYHSEIAGRVNEARHALGGAGRTLGAAQCARAPTTPGARRTTPRKGHRMLCFSTNWAIKRINPHQRQQEESYVQDFQFHRQR